MKTFIAAAVLALLLAGQALAQSAAEEQKKNVTPPVRPSTAAAGSTVQPDREAARRLFRELDRNRDGYLSEDELWGAGGRQENWAASDRDADGRIDASEFIVLPSR